MLHIVSRRSETQRMPAKRRARPAVGLGAEIEPKERALVVGRELAVRREVGEVEERGREAGIVPVDQPQPLAVVDEVRGQEVVVAEHDLDRPERALEPLDQSREAAAAPAATGCAPSSSVARVVAQDVKGPEHQHRAAQVLRHLAVAAAHELDDAGQHLGPADVLGRERPAVDEAHDQRARLGMHHLRRQPGGMRRKRRRALVEAHHLMDRDVVADPDHEALAAVPHDEVGVGHAAGKRLRRDRPAPAGQALGLRFRIDDHRKLI